MTLNRRLAIALGFTALLGAAVVQAEELKKAAVPFAFEVAGQKMEAGTYETSRHSAGGVLLIQNSKTRKATFLTPIPAGPAKNEQSILTFRCFGSQCFLERIQFGDTGTAYVVSPSKREKELAKAGERPQDTLVAMR